MKAVTTFSFMTIVALALLSFSFCKSKAAKKENNSGTDNGFVVVELFTSEGCSSCPPADELMIKLAKEFPEKVYFLGYHVDYWNYIGWKDEFSNADYTKRQNKYAELLGLSSIYTPQAIINGEKELVGSKESQLRGLIADKLKQETSATITLMAKKTDQTVTVSCRADNAGKAILNIALVQLMATTNVKRGENEGRKLNHIDIVRDLKTVSVNKEINSSVTLKIPAGLGVKDLKVVAFLQNEEEWNVTGAAETSIQ